MGDFNVCEHVNSLFQQQVRIRQLLNLLRYNQERCNNVDCITEDIQLPETTDSFDVLSFLLLMALMFGAIFTLIRPNLVKSKEKSVKRSDGDDDSDNNGRPVPPPVL